MGTGFFPGVEAAEAWADSPPHLVPKVLEKSRAIPLLTLRACVAYKKGENPYLNVHPSGRQTACRRLHNEKLQSLHGAIKSM